MLFAVKYHASPNRSEEQSRLLRDLFISWTPPHGVEIQHHFHYVSGGGVLIVDTDSASLLFEALQPFQPMVDVDLEPVVNIIEAIAISLDVDEWIDNLKRVDGKMAGHS